jgi:hypothetical protein
MSDDAPDTLIPSQEAAELRVKSAPKEALFQVAMSLMPGAVFPVQLAPRLSSVPEEDLIMDPALALPAINREEMPAHMTKRQICLVCLIFMLVFLILID